MNKVVYIHRKKTNGEIFYIGMGNSDRPYQKSAASRSVVWHRVVNKYGYYVEVIRKDLSKAEAFDIEIQLIELIGRRDKGLGSLVNLTDGGEAGGGNGKECYNIETGKIYKTIGDACKDVGVPCSTVTDYLNKSSKFNYNTPIRTLDNPYPEDALPKNTIYLEDLKNFDIIDNTFEPDDKEQVYLNRFDDLPIIQQDLIHASFDKSTREIGREFNINYCHVHRQIHKGLKKILKEDYHLYRNSSLKHLKNN
tara:strand:+ start:70 stop:822 length:753 start_codon:yes stop_codon:yes gene_type:complete